MRVFSAAAAAVVAIASVSSLVGAEPIRPEVLARGRAEATLLAKRDTLQPRQTAVAKRDVLHARQTVIAKRDVLEPRQTAMPKRDVLEPRQTALTNRQATILPRDALLPRQTAVPRSIEEQPSSSRLKRRGFWRLRPTTVERRQQETMVARQEQTLMARQKPLVPRQETLVARQQTLLPRQTLMPRQTVMPRAEPTLVRRADPTVLPRDAALPAATILRRQAETMIARQVAPTGVVRRQSPTEVPSRVLIADIPEGNAVSALGGGAQSTLVFAPRASDAPTVESEEDFEFLEASDEEMIARGYEWVDDEEYEAEQEAEREAEREAELERRALEEGQQRLEARRNGRDFSFLKRDTVDLDTRLDDESRSAIAKRQQLRFSVLESTEACFGPSGPIPASPARTYSLPKNHPKPLVGDYEAVGADGNSCTTYEDRYIMYTDEALAVTYRADKELPSVGAIKGPLRPDNTTDSEWEAELRAAMRRSNERAIELGPDSFPDWRALMDRCGENRNGAAPVLPRATRVDEELTAEDAKARVAARKGTAVVLRSYEGYVWREDDILNLRALIAETNLNSDKPWDIRILLEVHNHSSAVRTSAKDRRRVLMDNIPREFWGMVEFWSVPEMCNMYPGMKGQLEDHVLPQSSYRSCFMAVQAFHHEHSYEYIWNLEHDVRYLGNWRELFEGTAAYARKEAQSASMSKYKNWLIPGLDKSRDDWADEENNDSMRGEEADLVTLSPIFDSIGSEWYWSEDIQNYAQGKDTPRRASIGTNVRLSANLLEAMSLANSEQKQSTHCESWPETIVMHSGMPSSANLTFGPQTESWGVRLPMKGVFAPIPNYFNHNWDLDNLYQHINLPDFYNPELWEGAMKDSSQYFHSRHARQVYVAWRNEPDSICRAPAFLHPTKRID